MKKSIKTNVLISMLLILSILVSPVSQLFSSIVYAEEVNQDTVVEETKQDNAVEETQQDTIVGETKKDIVVEETNQDFVFDETSGTITGYKDGNAPENLVIPASINGVDVEHIGQKAFLYSTTSSLATINSPLKTLTLPEGLKTIGDRSFQGNELTKVTIPSTVEALNGGTFRLNKKLTTVTFAEDSNLKILGEESLYDCIIENIILPEGLKEIGERALAGNNLTSIKVPDSVITIGRSAFQLNLIEEFEVPKNIETLNGGQDSGGLFFRNFNNSGKQGSNLRLTKVYDTTGKATALNTRGIVNPVSVDIKYINADTKEEIKSTDNVVGKENKKIVIGKNPTYGWDVVELGDGGGDYIYDYMTPSDKTELYSKYFAEISSNYFTKGDEVTFIPANIPGYTAPSEKSIVLNDNVNDLVFSYQPLENILEKAKGRFKGRFNRRIRTDQN